MAETKGSAFPAVRQLIARQLLKPLSDQELLERFVTGADSNAFEELARRHGALVFRVCRRILRDHHLAEDACQATFLVLARKAASVAKRPLLANWLYGVAQRTAQRAQADAIKHRKRRTPDTAATMAEPEAEAARRELCAIVDEEILRLPEQCRAVVLLCYLEGRTRDQAAKQLGLSLRTVERLLERGRVLLRARLTRRGLTLSGALLTVELSQPAAFGALPAGFATSVGAEAARFLAGNTAAAGEFSIRAAALAHAVLFGMAATKVKAVAALVVVLGMVVAAGGLAVGQNMSATTKKQTQKPAALPQPPLADPLQQAALALDGFGDPLPQGAVARMGTIRFRHADTVDASAFLPDGKSIISAGRDGTVRLWDVATGRELRRFEFQGQGIPFLALSPNGARLATIIDQPHEEQSITLWDVATGKGRTLLTGPTLSFDCLAWSSDSKLLAVGGGQGSVLVFDAESLQQLHALAWHKYPPRGVSFSPDGTQLASCGSDGNICVAALKSLDKPLVLRGPERYYSWLAFAPDGKTFISAGGGSSAAVNSIAVWDAATGKRLRDFKVGGTELHPHMVPFARLKEKRGLDAPHSTCWALSSDGKTLALGYPDLTFHLWDVATGKSVGKLTSYPEHCWPARHLVFSPDGKTLAAAGGLHCAVCLLEMATDKHLLAPRVAHGMDVRALAMSRNGKIIATGGSEGLLILWNAATGEPIHELKGNERQVNTVAFSPDGRRVANGGMGPLLCMWDSATGKLLWQQRWEFTATNKLDGGGGRILAVDFTPDGKAIAVVAVRGFGSGWIKMFDADTGKELRDFQPALEAFSGSALAFSADGKMLTAAGDQGSVVRWDVSSGKAISELPDKKGHFPTVTISWDGTLATLGDNTGILNLWDMGKCKIHLAIPKLEGFNYSSAFSPDDRYVAVASSGFMPVKQKNNLVIELVELATGQVVCTHPLPPYTGVVSMTFSADGRQLATGMFDTTALIWDMQPPPLKKAAKVEELWQALAGTDAPVAWQAAAAMIATPAETVEFLKRNLVPAQIDRPLVQQLIADLGSDQFNVRDKATKRLKQFGPEIGVVLEPTLAKNPPLEVRQRLQQLQASHVLPLPPGDALRGVRAVAVLERIGTLPARNLLEALAMGAPEAWLTREASMAVKRLAR